MSGEWRIDVYSFEKCAFECVICCVASIIYWLVPTDLARLCLLTVPLFTAVVICFDLESSYKQHGNAVKHDVKYR